VQRVCYVCGYSCGASTAQVCGSQLSSFRTQAAGSAMPGSASRPTAVKSEAAKGRRGKHSLPSGIRMPKEGEPGTLTAMLGQNAVPQSGRLKRKASLPSEESDEESKREEQEPFDPEMETQIDALFSEEHLRPDYRGRR